MNDSSLPDKDVLAQEHRPAFDAASQLTPRMIPMIGVVVAVLLLELSIATFLEVQSQEAASLVIGAIFSQLVLYAVWCTLAPFHLFTRVIVGTTLFGIAATCMYLCALRDGGGISVAITITSAMLVQWLLYQVPLWHTRSRGWSLGTSHVEPTIGGKSDLRFGISQLLVWTAIVAFFLAILRMLFRFSGSGNAGGANLEVSLFTTLALGNSVLILPLVYACFSRDRTLLWLVISGVWAVLVTAAEALLLWRSANDFEFIGMINFVQFLVVLATLCTVRWAGFRLQQDGTGNPAQHDSSL